MDTYERWVNDKHQIVNKINYRGENIFELIDDQWNIERVTSTPNRIYITIERKPDNSLLKEELKEKLLRYGFSSVDMTVTEFVDDFFKKYFNERG